MAAEAEVLDELHRLRSRVPQLTGALAASVDGLVLAQDTPGAEPGGVAALTAAALGVAVRMTDTTGQGDFRELLIRGVNGYVATYAAGSSAVLTLLADDRVNVGRLHLEGRRAGTRIGELIDAAMDRAEPQRTTAATADAEPTASARAASGRATAARVTRQRTGSPRTRPAPATTERATTERATTPQDADDRKTDDQRINDQGTDDRRTSSRTTAYRSTSGRTTEPTSKNR
ncbi:roadblock/LC7 domain-containing protein [Streptomyces sp. PSKA54]|uniref:Roadblock/LC7 domain-containing protein n=1 Tax=Streptomyces himalayensis subsp. aureolus TaxID=2758039 RepID=A0A7W2D2S3_9ACTN|nr:roadblock/LC7 domain-containing protein [Streptomyces himalayensis]MBA4863690.1 roadblock/LC7 domain-containing protein [Streptomyces himalayensis subsp. aureolus]